MRSSPPRLGGVAVTSRNIAKRPLKGADGAVDKGPKNCFGILSTAPSAASRWLSHLFFGAAATPPNLGGEFARRHVSLPSQNPYIDVTLVTFYRQVCRTQIRLRDHSPTANLLFCFDFTRNADWHHACYL